MALIGYYPLLDGDLTNHVTSSLLTSYVTGSYEFIKIENRHCIKITAVNSNIRFVFDPNLTNYSNFTMSIWIYITNYNQFTILTAGSAFSLVVENNGLLKISSNYRTPNILYSDNTIGLNKWYNVTLSFTSTIVNLYIDGSLDKTSSWVGSPGIISAVLSYNSLYNGYATGFRFYTHVITQSELDEIIIDPINNDNCLIAWYPMNINNATDIVVDYSSLGTDGINFYGVSLVADNPLFDQLGRLGWSANFAANASMRYHRPGFKLQGSFNWSVWFKCYGSTPNTYQFLLSEGRDMGYNGVNIVITGSTTQSLRAFVNGSSLVISDIVPGRWHHVSMNIDYNNIEIYFDGVLTVSSTISTPIDYSYSQDRFVIGKMSYGYTNATTYFPYSGAVNDVRIYNRCLSVKEIKELFKCKWLHWNFEVPVYMPTTMTQPPESPGPFIGAYNGTAYGFGSPPTYSNLQKGINNFILFRPNTTILRINRVNSNVTQRDELKINLGLTANEVKTLSFWYFGTYGAQITLTTPTYANVSIQVLDINNDWNTGSYSQIINVPVNQWYKVVARYTNNNSYSVDGIFWIKLHTDNPTVSLLNTEHWLFTNFSFEGTRQGLKFPDYQEAGIEYISDSSGFQRRLGNLYDVDVIDDVGTGYKSIHVSNGQGYEENVSSGMLTVSLTVSVWFKSHDYGQNDNAIFSFSNDQNFLCVQNSGQFMASFMFSGNVNIWAVTTGSSLLDDKWHLLTVTVDTTNMKLYVDGVLRNTTATNRYLKQQGVRLNLGYRWNINGQNYSSLMTNGRLDDLRVYATVLTQEDITELYYIGQQIHDNGSLESVFFKEYGYSNLIEYRHWELGDLPYTYRWTNQSNPVQITRAIVNELNPVQKNDLMIKTVVVDTTYAANRYNGFRVYPSDINYNLDITKTYRVSCWVYISYDMVNYIYFGLTNSSSDIINNINTTTINTNPYPITINGNTYPYKNQWLLLTSYIYPNGSTGNTNESWIYLIDGTKLTSYYTARNSFNFGSGANSSNFFLRWLLMYQYSTPNMGQYVKLYRPRIDLCDGTELSIDELLRCNDSSTNSSMIGTFHDHKTGEFNNYKEAFTNGLTFLKDDNDVVQKINCQYVDNKVYAKKYDSGVSDFIVKNITFNNIFNLIDTAHLEDRVVPCIDNGTIYVTRLIEN